MSGNVPKIEITDVTARDGFQMEQQWIPTEKKVEVINRIIHAGVKRVEATSFVSPKAVPQLRDAKKVLEIIKKENTVVTVLVPNKKGAESALDVPIDEVNVVVSVSETHNLRNIKRTVQQSIDEIYDISNLLQKKNKRLNVGLATTFGCPFEGLYSVEKVTEVIEKLRDLEISCFTLSDTTGMANPKQIKEFIHLLMKKFPSEQFSLHLHNTRGMGLVNLLSGYEAGIKKFDASLGGIGGCPFAPGATGNVCLEDTVHMFEQMGVETGISMENLISTANYLENLLGYKLSGQVMKSGPSTRTFT